MAPRLSFSPFRTHYFFLTTVVLSIVVWFLTLVSQALATAQFGNRTVGVLWFAIFLQAFLDIGVILAIATDSVPAMRLQVSVFGSIAIVLSVQGIHAGIFAPLKAESALDAMGVGYLLCTIIDLLWVLYFTSEEDSLAMYLFNKMTKGGAGGGLSLTRRRRGNGMDKEANLDNYVLGAGISSSDIVRRASIARSMMSTHTASAPISVPPVPAVPGPSVLKRSNTGTRSLSSRKSVVSLKEDLPLPPSSPGYIPPMPLHSLSSVHIPEHSYPYSSSPARVSSGINIPVPSIISSSIGVTIPAVPKVPDHARSPSSSTIKAASNSVVEVDDNGSVPLPRARALHAYQGSPDDPDELTFAKGEILEIEDQQGKWWQAKKADGTFGVVPSNYLVLL
ncbi:hypothetical protein MIND_01404800 [Mycena indigotica]|uniref:SH3 domain-containing protein n=1 Tax=Mycena indigotica TaxID=2126181 RepID=A0A8H6VSY3_9AGAR|nr:uncharacterized protein MIND_01404800 [Mycena indigotica]KAF7288888.1 hypothetical protein MIND_01404800 [Mycena indigotica]